VESNRHHESAPIGFYFAKLWYYEKLYPLIWTVAALGPAARERLRPSELPAVVHTGKT
jgi:squalene-hopene/tetraprenyl-beta-curcumene cyclase